MKMRRFVALLLCLSVLMTAGSALGDISFQDDDGNELTGRQLAMDDHRQVFVGLLLRGRL